jgi:hypothetical protein
MTMWSLSLLLLIHATCDLATGRPTCDATSGVCVSGGRQLFLDARKQSSLDLKQPGIEPQCLYEPIDLGSCSGDDGEAFFGSESMQPARSATPEERSKVSRPATIGLLIL